ncbi:MAG: DUF86 domain-containing protein [Ignavibacteriae bacterium]|nr:DUF86 domain-containing protein [Ignavibacteriota bacterium]
MSKRSTNLLLNDMLKAISKIERFVHGISFEEFINDERTFDAVVRNLEILGEAASKIPEEIRDQYEEIEWHRIVGLRNRIVDE